MNTDGWALPDALRASTFTAAEAAALGVGQRRLSGERARQIHRGIWADADCELDVAQRAAAALRVVGPHAWISHASGAHLLELPLPPQLRELDHIDVSVTAPARAPRRAGIVGRQRREGTPTSAIAGIPVSSPAQAFVDGCDYLDFEDLVALGDGIVCELEPRATVTELLAVIDAHRGHRRHGQLLAAAQSLHPRARSRPETIHRLQLRKLGVPEPWCNVPVLLDEGDPLAPDAAFWPARLVIEVEGDHHRVDRQQWRIDLERYNRMQRLDIESHRVVVTTVAETLRQLKPIAERIRRRWDNSREAPTVAPFFHGEPALGNAPWLFRERSRERP